ncbi:MAG: PhzF family phenazine biosynthesis protein [Actinobacteria bacterium]|nr:MAG: PhzF family phenazine biosynthesis protein [Actinomycetota bacterium]
MTRHDYTLVDVFTDRRFGGNQLAVFRDGRGIADADMQAIAKELMISETTFVLPREKDGDHRVRIFTPGRELQFAGHPTVGTAWVLSRGRDGTLRLELGVGTISVRVTGGFVEMDQPLPQFGGELPAEQLRPKLRAAIGDVLEHDAKAPYQVVSCGNAFLLAAVDGLRGMRALRVDQNALAALLGEVGGMGLFVWTTETERPGSVVHGRMFPTGVGITEDPATGSANGPLAAYLVRHGLAKAGERIVTEQGFEIGRPSFLYARIDGSAERISGVHVGGNVVAVSGGWFDL